MTPVLSDDHGNSYLSPKCIELLTNITEDKIILVGRCELSKKIFKFMGEKYSPSDAPLQVWYIKNHN